MQATFLLISDRKESQWSQVLARALAPLGELQVVLEKEAVQHTLQHGYDTMIVDAAVIDDVPFLISRLRAQQPQARIVVVSASPTWERAREALLAGAMDYIHRSTSKEELVSTFENIIARVPPYWPFGRKT